MNNLDNTIKKYLQELLAIASPTGNTYGISCYITDKLDSLAINYTLTNKGSILVKIPGIDSTYGRIFSGHVDTLGAMVKEINGSGTLSLVPIGGFMMSSIDGENCFIETLDGNVYSGTIQNIKPSVHISGDEARNLKKTPQNMEVVLDEKVFSKNDVENLGINVGDFISFETRTLFTDSGFIKSRHLDDKASVALLLTAIEQLVKTSTTLPYDTYFFISTYEEVGHGAKAGLPENAKEFIAVDMGAPGPNQNSSEYAVCICAKDSSGPYDLNLRKTLIDICKVKNIDYKIDIYPFYGSDASAALGAGYDVRTALIGPGVFASHAYERTHMDSMRATLSLILNYVSTK